MYKYEIENELKELEEVPFEYFENFVNKKTKKFNKIVLFKNRDQEYSSYYCTYCNKWHFIKTKLISHLEKGDFITCGNCKTRLEIIYRNNCIDKQFSYITYIDTNKRNDLIIRLFYYEKVYMKKYGVFSEVLLEVERINVNHRVYMKNNSYKVMNSYDIYHSHTNKWTKDRTGFYESYMFNNVVNSSNDINKIMCKIDDLKYSCLDIAIKNKIDILKYIKLWINYPKVELLMKAGCTRIVSDICNSGVYSCHPSIFNKLSKKDLSMIKKFNVSYSELQMYRKIKIEDYDLLKKAVVVHYDDARMEHKVDKTINYLYRNKYSVRDYEDYLEWCRFLGMDMKDKRVLYPSNPREAHDEVLKEFKIKENKDTNEKIASFSKELEKYNYQKGGLLIFPAHSQDDLINESKVLVHCVRTYATQVANKTTSIFFVRKKNDQNTPFYTLELRNKRVVQCRGYKNNINVPIDESVKMFVNDWCKKFEFSSCFS